MKGYYRFAGIDFQIEIPESVPFRESETLARFRADPVKDAHVFRFSLKEKPDAPAGELIYNEGGFREYGTEDVRVRYVGTVKESWEAAYIRAEHRGKQHTVQLREDHFPNGIGSKTVLHALWSEHLAARNRGFLFHCAYIAQNGKAILFTAPSETGKSTQAELWKKYRGSRIINGDRCAVRWTERGPEACGIPFSGSSSYCENRTLPLGCVVYLSQAPKSTIRRLRGVEAFSRIWEGCSVNFWDREDMALVSETVSKIAGSVPVYHLACTPDETAVAVLEQALRKQVDQP